MMEVGELKLFLRNLSVCEQLSGREKAGKLECSKKIKEKQRFQRCPRLAAKIAYYSRMNSQNLKLNVLWI